MPLIVRLHSIYRRLRTRFDIAETGDIEPTSILKEIRVITNADELLKKTRAIEDTTASIGAGTTTWTELFTVPAGKRWRLLAVALNRATGDNTIDQIRFSDTSEGEECSFSQFTAVSTKVVSDFNPFTLEETDQIQVHPSGAGVAGSTFTGWAIVEEEDAY